MPERYLSRPDIEPHHAEFIEGFHKLSVSRAIYPGGMGGTGQIGFISMMEMEAYCRMAQIDDPMDFMEVIRHMDAIYVNYQNDKLTSGTPKS